MQTLALILLLAVYRIQADPFVPPLPQQQQQCPAVSREVRDMPTEVFDTPKNAELRKRYYDSLFQRTADSPNLTPEQRAEREATSALRKALAALNEEEAFLLYTTVSWSLFAMVLVLVWASGCVVFFCLADNCISRQFFCCARVFCWPIFICASCARKRRMCCGSGGGGGGGDGAIQEQK